MEFEKCEICNINKIWFNSYDLRVDERFYLPKQFSKRLEQKLLCCWIDSRGRNHNRFVKFPSYYEKINLNVRTKLKWKYYDKEHSCYYHNNLKKPFPYKVIMRIQDVEYNGRISAITILPKWKNKFTDDELSTLDDYFYNAFPDIPTNPNHSFIELIFNYDTTLPVTFCNVHMCKSFIFKKLDEIVHDMKKALIEN